MDAMTGIKKTDIPTCKLCGYVTMELTNGMCEQCALGEVDDPYY